MAHGIEWTEKQRAQLIVYHDLKMTRTEMSKAMTEKFRVTISKNAVCGCLSRLKEAGKIQYHEDSGGGWQDKGRLLAAKWTEALTSELIRLHSARFYNEEIAAKLTTPEFPITLRTVEQKITRLVKDGRMVAHAARREHRFAREKAPPPPKAPQAAPVIVTRAYQPPAGARPLNPWYGNVRPLVARPQRAYAPPSQVGRAATCQYIAGEVGRFQMPEYCGAPSAPGYSYCADCKPGLFVRVRDRREDDARGALACVGVAA